MKTKCLLAVLMTVAAAPGPLFAQTLWDRRTINSAYLFHDFRARNIGDVLTIVIAETTGLDAQEKRELAKQTSAEVTTNGTLSYSALSGVLRSFGYGGDITGASNRSFNGNANNQISRNFTDRLTVIVVDVLPNGNLIVEGCREQMITHERRTLFIRGVVRPGDIGPYNTVQSQSVANLSVHYEGKGPESSFANQGWVGFIFNKLWPF